MDLIQKLVGCSEDCIFQILNVIIYVCNMSEKQYQMNTNETEKNLFNHYNLYPSFLK